MIRLHLENSAVSLENLASQRAGTKRFGVHCSASVRARESRLARNRGRVFQVAAYMRSPKE